MRRTPTFTSSASRHTNTCNDNHRESSSSSSSYAQPAHIIVLASDGTTSDVFQPERRRVLSNSWRQQQHCAHRCGRLELCAYRIGVLILVGVFFSSDIVRVSSSLWNKLNELYSNNIAHQMGTSITGNLLKTLSDETAAALAPTEPLFHPLKSMTTLSSPTTKHSYQVSERAKSQILSYQSGTALILHIHITHHGGHDFCDLIGHATGVHGQHGATAYACRVDRHRKEWDFVPDSSFPKHDPWEYNQTSENIKRLRERFHFVSWEYYIQSPSPPLRETNWEDPNLLSVIVMRDPISRLLAGDGWVARFHHNVHLNQATEEEWWDYANTTHGDTDNFALRTLAGKDCCAGNHTEYRYLEYAKALVSRFSIVLDHACLDEGMEAFADLVGIKKLPRADNVDPPKKHPPNEQRIPYRNVYDFLVERNKLDLELYEWSKSISLVNCNALKHNTSNLRR